MGVRCLSELKFFSRELPFMLSLLMPHSFPHHSGLTIYQRLVMLQKTDEARIYSKGIIYLVID